MPKFILALLLSFTLSVPALAHKVVASAWIDGADIEGEVGLSNGEMAPDGTMVKVFDLQGNKLGETTINGDGLFRYTPTQPIAHHFSANLGAGHVATVIVNPDELPDGLRKNEQSAPVSSVKPNLSTNSTEIATLVAKAVRKEVQPLRKEIAQYKEKNDLQTILGGIGYILGLTGIVFYIAARRKEKNNT